MNERETNHLKNLVLICMGIIVSLAGLIYIVKQYSKMLSSLLTNGEELPYDACANKVKTRFRQIPQNEDTLSPETVEDEDMAADIDE